MFIEKKFIPRRTFLRGAGVTLGLPLLDSMIPAQTPLDKTVAVPPKRFLGIWHPHGAAPGYWSPQQEGSNFEFSFITKPLEPFRNRVSPYLGVTLDQLIAQKHGQDTILESIQVGVEEDGNFGNCNWGYSCAYTNCISWNSPVQPLPTEVNPRVAFERLFGDGTSSEERRRGRRQSASILDSVTQEIAFFRKPLGVGDKAKLDTYLDNVRELERRIKIAMDKTIKEP